MKKIFKVIKIHSNVDLITNSSTELFCTVKAENKKLIEKILKEILKEFGCYGVEFSVYEREDDNGDIIDGEYAIFYDYEINHAPCKLMSKKIKSKLNVK